MRNPYPTTLLALIPGVIGLLVVLAIAQAGRILSGFF